MSDSKKHEKEGELSCQQNWYNARTANTATAMKEIVISAILNGIEHMRIQMNGENANIFGIDLDAETTALFYAQSTSCT